MQTVTLEDNEFGIFQLLDMIQRTERALKFHQDSPEPDTTAVTQYTEKLNEYRRALVEELNPYGVELIAKPE